MEVNCGDLRTRARSLKEQEKYSEAVEVYQQIYTPNSDSWIGWEYTFCLKKLSKIDKAIEVSKNTYVNNKNFKYNNNILSWLLYEKYFKELNENYTYIEIDRLYKIAEFVSEITEQDSKSAYEIVMIKMLKILKNHGNNFFKEILNILNKLNSEMLSESAGKYKENGREREYQSHKEMYYASKTKALFELKLYDDCIFCCDEALNVLQQFHHNNDIWIKSRKAKSLANIGKIEDAIRELENAIILKNHWSLYSDIAHIYLMKNDNNNSLFYFCRAAITKDPAKMKVTLYYELAKLLNSMGDYENAWKHLCFAKSQREKEEWNIPIEMQELLEELSKNEFSYDVNFFELRDFWLDKIYQFGDKKQGTVIKINANKKSGFIKTGSGSYYFKTSSVIGKTRIRPNDRVSFCLIKSYDNFKKRNSQECSYIRIDR